MGGGAPPSALPSAAVGGFNQRTNTPASAPQHPVPAVNTWRSLPSTRRSTPSTQPSTHQRGDVAQGGGHLVQRVPLRRKQEDRASRSIKLKQTNSKA